MRILVLLILVAFVIGCQGINSDDIGGRPVMEDIAGLIYFDRDGNVITEAAFREISKQWTTNDR